MKRISIIPAVIFLIYSGVILAQDTKPIRDNVGFCWDAHQLGRLMDYLKSVERSRQIPAGIVAAVSPHDDYLYAAHVYYPLYRALRAKEVVIFGVTHGDVRPEIGDPHGMIILDDFRNWPGPLHTVEISPLREYIKSRLDTSYYIVSNKAHALEHSIEALVPFIQYFNHDVKIVPIMVTQMPFGRMDTISDQLSSIIADYLKANRLVPGKDIAFLISSDADHYGPDFNNSPYGLDEKAHEEATENDRRIAHKDLDGILSPSKIDDLTMEMKNTLWCGKFSVPFGLLTSDKIIRKVDGKELKGQLLRYSDSYTEGVIPLRGTGMGTTAPASYKHWCGWLSEAYYSK